MTEASIVSQRMIYELMISKEDKILNEQESKRESILKDIFSVMNVKKDLEKNCVNGTNDFESLKEKPEKLGDIVYVVEMNGVKRKRKEKIEEIKKLEEALECLEKKTKKKTKENS